MSGFDSGIVSFLMGLLTGLVVLLALQAVKIGLKEEARLKPRKGNRR